MVFELFKEDIQIIKNIEPISDRLNIQSMLVKCTINNNINGLKYLMKPCNGHLQYPYQEVTFKNIITSLNFNIENISSTLEILNSIIFSNNGYKLTNDEIYSSLEKISNCKTSNIYGEMFISKLGIGIINKSSISIKPPKITSVILFNNDLLLLDLLIRQISKTTKKLFKYQQINDFETIGYGNGGLITFNSYIIKLLGINKEMLYSSNMFELFKILVINGKTNKEYQKFQLHLNPSRNQIIISNSEIANYLFENIPINRLNCNLIVFHFSTIDENKIKTNDQYIKLLSNDSIEWYGLDFNGLKEYHIEFIIKNNHVIPQKNYLVQKLIDENKFNLIKLLFDKSPLNLFNPFKSFVAHTVRVGNEQITNYIFSKVVSYIDKDKDYTEFNILDNYFKLLIESIKYCNNHSFKCIMESPIHDNLIRHINENKSSLLYYGNLYQFLPKLNFEKRCQFISLLSEIDKKGDLMFAIKNPTTTLSWSFEDTYYFNQDQDFNQISKTNYINLIIYSIENENYKLLKQLLLSNGLSFNLNDNKKQLIHFTLKNGITSKNNHYNRSLLYMISIGYLCSLSDLERIVKYSIQLKNYTVLNLLLCRGNYKIVPFKNRHALESEYNFHQYIEWVHCFIFKYSINGRTSHRMNYEFIEILITDGYQYKSNKVGYENEGVKLYLEKQGIFSSPLLNKYLSSTSLSKSTDYISNEFDLLKDLHNIHIKF